MGHHKSRSRVSTFRIWFADNPAYIFISLDEKGKGRIEPVNQGGPGPCFESLNRRAVPSRSSIDLYLFVFVFLVWSSLFHSIAATGAALGHIILWFSISISKISERAIWLGSMLIALLRENRSRPSQPPRSVFFDKGGCMRASRAWGKEKVKKKRRRRAVWVYNRYDDS